jgi:membrane-associated phospholipid phosphatase
MSSTAVAEASAGPPVERDTNPHRGWRSHWVARFALPAIYLLGTAVAVDRIGLPYSQDWIFVWIVGLMVAFSIGDGQHSVRRLIKDWLPIIVALLAYDLLRGVADGNLFAIHWGSPVHADKVLGLGKVPTIRLQDALYTPGHLHFWDYAAFSFWFSHFFATLLVAVGIWLYAYRWFHRFAACIVLLAAMGLVTYVVFPAAPPWLAGGHGYLPHTYRITHAVVNNLPVPKAGALFQSGTDWGNDVAAVPSLHAGYTMLICLFLWPRVNRRWRPLLVAYPLGMAFSLIYLGEHYLIDILLGWAYAGATILIVNWGAERWAKRRRPQDISPAAAPKAEPQPS